MKNNFKRIAAFLLALGVVIPQSALLEGFSVNAIEETDAGEFLCEESGFQPDSEEVEKEIAVLAEFNDGVSPEISTNNDNVVKKIDGVLSEETIESSWDVKELISNIDDLLGVENINQQLKFEDSSDGLYNTVYKFKQCYEGIEILNSSISIVVDKKTKIGKFLNSSFIPGFSIDINPDILSDEAAKIVVDKYSVGISKDPELVIFPNADEEQRLAWYIITDSISPSEVYVDAKTGEILYQMMPDYFNEEGDWAVVYTVEENNPLPEPFTVNIARDKDYSDLYKLHDTRRNIYVLDSQDVTTDKSLVISKKNNDWTGYETELAVLHNVEKAYDFYKSLDWYGYDGNRTDVFVLPSWKDDNNAHAYWNIGVLAFGAGTGNNKNWGLSYDVAVHEYTHLVTRNKVKWIINTNNANQQIGETASLNEAYSDIMAEYADGPDEWQHGTYHRSDVSYARDISKYPTYELKQDLNDIECHVGGKIISHAAYLMSDHEESGDEKFDHKVSNYEKFGYGIPNDYALQIWYESLCFLHSDATFFDCRIAVLTAATDVFNNNNVTDSEADYYMRKIKTAFNKVNVIDSSDNIGDINLDGNIDENDIVLLKNYINTKEVSLNSLQKYYADLTFDSKIDNSDLDVLINQVSPITITKQPINAFAKAGETVELSVSAEGEELNYKWYYCNPDSNVFVDTGVRRSECTIKMSDTVNGRKYYCKITGKFGNSVSTEEVTLTKLLGIPVNIIQQPANATAESMCGASTKVVAEGDMLTYKWYELEPDKKEFELASVRSGAEYTRRMVDGVNGTRVYCEISDMYGNTVRTDTIMLIEEGVPVKIIDQPTNVLAEIGSTVKTTVIAAGEELSYQWYVKNPGQQRFSKSSITNPEYITSMREEINERKIYCVITDKYKNSIQTDTVTIGLPLELKKDLDSVSVKMGEKLKTSIEATGCGLTYTWYYKNKGMPDFKVTNSFKGNTYDFDKMTEERDGRQIYCIITDIFGNSVQTKTVTLGVPVEITEDLVDVTAKFGEKVNFSVSATGHGLTYKWYFKNKNMSKFQITDSFKTNNYALDQITKARAGREVYCVITDIFGNSVQTKTIKIDLPTGYGDANCDGVVDAKDADAILKAYANSDKNALTPQGEKNADVSGGGGVTPDDALLIMQYLEN